MNAKFPECPECQFFDKDEVCDECGSGELFEPLDDDLDFEDVA